MKNFYNKEYYYSNYYPNYYPGYSIDKTQDLKTNIYYPYMTTNDKKRNNDIDTQVFYNTTDLNTTPWGSTYKYMMPKPISDTIGTSYNSISQQQRRRQLTHPSVGSYKDFRKHDEKKFNSFNHNFREKRDKFMEHFCANDKSSLLQKLLSEYVNCRTIYFFTIIIFVIVFFDNAFIKKF